MVLSSAADLGLSVRSACVDADSELDCANLARGAGTESLSFHVNAGVPLGIFVDGAPGAAGPFTLILTLTP
jgi:hypothetical protein